MSDINKLIESWITEKEIERASAENRRFIEDQLVELLKVDQMKEGSKTYNIDNFKIKTTSRLNRKVDSDKLQEIAAEYGLSEHLGDLFRWSPSINAKAWNNSSAEITAPLLDAITTTPSRTSFSIEKTGE